MDRENDGTVRDSLTVCLHAREIGMDYPTSCIHLGMSKTARGD